MALLAGQAWGTGLLMIPSQGFGGPGLSRIVILQTDSLDIIKVWPLGPAGRSKLNSILAGLAAAQGHPHVASVNA